MKVRLELFKLRNLERAIKITQLREIKLQQIVSELQMENYRSFDAAFENAELFVGNPSKPLVLQVITKVVVNIYWEGNYAVRILLLLERPKS